MPKGVVDETPPHRDDYQLAVVEGDYFTVLGLPLLPLLSFLRAERLIPS